MITGSVFLPIRPTQDLVAAQHSTVACESSHVVWQVGMAARCKAKAMGARLSAVGRSLASYTSLIGHDRSVSDEHMFGVWMCASLASSRSIA